MAIVLLLLSPAVCPLDAAQPNDEVTIAEALNPLGYLCRQIGAKWHVTSNGGLACISNRQGF
jgi:hypothetical protein